MAHIDKKGVRHPVTLVPKTESEDQHYAVCRACHTRWAGPFKQRDAAASECSLANMDSAHKLSARIRRNQGLCCEDSINAAKREMIQEKAPGYRPLENKHRATMGEWFVAFIWILGIGMANVVYLVGALLASGPVVLLWLVGIGGGLYGLARLNVPGPSSSVAAFITLLIAACGIAMTAGPGILRKVRTELSGHPAPEYEPVPVTRPVRTEEAEESSTVVDGIDFGTFEPEDV